MRENAAILILGVLLALPATAFADPSGRPGPGEAFVHLFEWTWPEIARECEAFLGPAGYNAVQISPPQEHVTGDAWWTRYQPVSYRLESRGGSRAELEDMVRRCHAAGVAVYADAVINHMADVGEGEGVAGSSYGLFDYPVPYGFDDFHHCGRHGDDSIDNYQDAWEVRNCQLGRLPDLDTGDAAVQEKIAAYLGDLVSIGVDGFRIDAAKHMEPTEIGAILSRLPGAPFIYQEVIDRGTEPITADAYTVNGDVTEFRYHLALYRALSTGELSGLRSLGAESGWVPSERAVVFIDNHDVQRGHAGAGDVLTYRDGARYELANVFMLAWPYGYPMVMSSYRIGDSDHGPPVGAPVNDQGLCSADWICEHRNPAIAAMVGFREQTAGLPVTNWNQLNPAAIIFERGDRGLVAINAGADPVDARVTVGLRPGRYRNVLGGGSEEATRTVGEDRTLALFLPPMSAVALLPATEPHSTRVRSPDGRIEFSLSTDESGVPRYTVTFDGEAVVTDSRLGLRFAQQSGFDRDLHFVEARTESHDGTWEQPWGERRLVRDRHEELAITFADSGGARFDLRVRVFDDGLGFRYEVPAQPGFETVEIVDELTEFRLPENSTAWWIPARRYNRYEYLYRETGLAAIETAHTPMTVRTPSGIHLSIHEAALTDYTAYVLDQRRERVFKTNLTPWSDGIRVRTAAPFQSPWRTIQVSEDAVGLLNSSLILNLNEPNALGDVSWVEPGKYVGIWWAMHIGQRTWGSGPKHGATTAETLRYMDFAANHGFSGVLVEGWNIGWDGDWFANGDLFSFTQAYPDFDLQAVTEYGRQKGVRLIGHHETAGSVSNYDGQMAAAFDLYAANGVTQVKTGYVADAGTVKRIDEDGIARYEWHDGQFMVDEYLRSVTEAAQRKISINSHEPIKDTGLRRTYPNWLSREGARGQEFNAWGVPPNPPEHTAILPYTRLLAGPMDFTPGIFDLTFQGPDSPHRVQTTLAKQLALYVTLYSPIQMAADLPENYLARPAAFQFIVDVPTDWEESIALAGEVGDYVVFARRERGGRDWYLGAVTDEDARQLEIPLDFLESGKVYVAQIYRDGPGANWKTDPYPIVIEEKSLTRDDVLKLELAPGGGAAVRFVAGESP